MKHVFRLDTRWIIILVGTASLALLFIGLLLPVKSQTFFFPHSADWDVRLSWSQAIRTSVNEYHQIPLWNPYRCGGAPLLGEAESDIVSVYTPFLMVFGPTVGYVISFFFYLFIGMYGLYKLARYVGISKAGSVLSGVGYFCSGLFIIPFVTGITNFLSLAYFPFVVLYIDQYLRSWNLRYAMYSGGCIALMFLSGFHYIPIVFLYVLIVSVIACLSQKRLKPLLGIGIIMLMFVGFSAIKLFPTLESFYTHTFDNGSFKFSGYSVDTLTYSLFSRNQSATAYAWPEPERRGFFHGFSYGIDENGMYVGWIFAALALWGFCKRRTSLFVHRVVFCVFFLIMFGENITPSLYSLLHQLPFFSFMRVAQRYRYIAMIPFVLFVGAGFDACVALLDRLLQRKKYVVTVVSVVALVVILFDMSWVNTRVFYDGFSVKPVQKVFVKSFVQVCVPNVANILGPELPIVSSGLGMRNCTENVLITPYAACIGEMSYKGEVYSMDSKIVVNKYLFSPNKLTLSIVSSGYGNVIINQNYDHGWIALVNGAFTRVTPLHGLLSVPISQGNSSIVLWYLPISFIFGVVLTVTTIVIAIKVTKSIDSAR